MYHLYKMPINLSIFADAQFTIFYLKPNFLFEIYDCTALSIHASPLLIPSSLEILSPPPLITLVPLPSAFTYHPSITPSHTFPRYKLPLSHPSFFVYLTTPSPLIDPKSPLDPLTSLTSTTPLSTLPPLLTPHHHKILPHLTPILFPYTNPPRSLPPL